ncbi:nicotinamide N-methyltransferase-like [Dendropsophus ebraccatus]|uniref:nicotinamide N-methyltransferase-like n=1 Tax=Dendropsophus ebraccatus TaxID=150705 RepID=UPI003831638F
MANTSHKSYFDEEHNPKDLLESHFSQEDVEIIDETMKEPAKRLHEVFSSGLVKGKTLLNVSIGSMVYPLISASNFFSDIYVIDTTDASVNHFKQWLKKGDEATDWSFVFKLVCQLEGNPAGWKEKEEQVRRAIKRVDLYNPFDSACTDSVVLPQLDCVIMVFLLQVICKTKEDFRKNLKTFTSWLKIGGHLVSLFAINMTFYRVGEQKFSSLTMDEKFMREELANAGFEIVKEEILPTSIETDLVDYKNFYFSVVRKVRNP